MVAQQYATILAQTDPFDVAQGLERYIRSLSGEQVRFVILAAGSHMNESYRDEFMPLLEQTDDAKLSAAFIQALKSNLRAIPLFGPTFCEGVIEHTPGDRAIALGEEGYRLPRVRPVAFAIIAIALLIGGAAAEHVWSNARANAQTPVVLETPPPIVVPAPVKVARAASPPVRSAAPATRPPATPTPAPATPTPAPVTATPAPATATPAPAAAAPAPAAAAPAPARKPQRTRARRTPPAGHGVATIIAVQRTPAPSPQPTDVNVDDMPQSYTDATPLPRNEEPPTPRVAPASVATPTPAPNRYWLHSTVQGTLKTIDRLNPFKHHSAPSPSASPSGPQPR